MAPILDPEIMLLHAVIASDVMCHVTNYYNMIGLLHSVASLIPRARPAFTWEEPGNEATVWQDKADLTLSHFIERS